MTSPVQNNQQLVRLPTTELLVKLIQAARFNYPDRVLQLLQQGADVNARIRPQVGVVSIGIEDNIDDDDDEDFTTALEHAVHYRNDRIVATLLDYGADMNCINGKSETALIAAISRGYDEIVELLLNKGADVNFVGGGQYGTALTAAVCRDHGEIIKLLLGRGVDANITTSGGKYGTALIAAICMDDVELVELLLDKGADANVVGDDEYGTALIAAICKRNSDSVKLLLDKGADFNIIGGGKYGTALTAAICKRNRGFVQLLLDRGADVDIVSTNSQYGTALIAAICERNGEFVRLLVDKGVNVNIIGGCDYGTALIAAICERTRNFLELLLDIGGDVNIAGGKHGTALIAAICGGDEGIVKALLDKGADVNLIATGSKYGTALIAAICGGDEKMIKLLLDRGADVNILATGGKYGTALIAAICTDHGKIVELLLERGADVNIVGGEYGTALIATIACALWQNCEKTIDLLLDRGADVNSVGGKYGTALIAAIWENTREFVGLLLDRGAEVNKVGGEYGTALIAAICRGDEDMHMLNLLLSEGADVNIVGGKHGTALMAAICNLKSHEHVGFVELLLNIGADVNIAGGEYGTALIAAICKEEWETVQLLLKNEADVNAVMDSNEYGHPGTALIAAVRQQEEHLVLELLGRGAAVNGRGGSGNPYTCETALGVAIWQSNQLQALTFASVLLEKGADVNMVVGAFGSLLGRAAYEGDVERILYLERIGANPLHVGGSYPTARGEYPTALDAARSGKAGPDVIALLSRIIDKALLSQAQLQSCIPMRIDHIIHDHEQSIYEQTSTVLLKMHSTTALPPFPVPYSWNSMTIRACALPQLRPSMNPTEAKVLNLDFQDACAGCPLTPEQADLPCNEIDATVLARSLLSLVGISTEAANHHQAWIQNDIRYFVSYGYDLGLAYAAARVAWKDFNNPAFNVAAHRGDWLRKAMDIEEARNNSIYRDETGQELINSPYEIMPRRIWDLKSNRVVEFTMLHSHVLIHDSKNTCPPKACPTFSAITHSWTDTMSIVNTSINQYQWPVPVPDGVDLNMHLRAELLKYGNDYVWLDVLCLRQNGGLDVVQRDEWKLDVPTIGNIFRVADKIIRYFNGLGIAFSSEEWDNPRNWLRRAWTLQEIRTENKTINAGIARDGNSTRIIMNTRGKYSFGKITTLRRVLRPVLKLAAEIDSPGSCSVYELAREMSVRHATHPTDKVAGLLYLLRITQLPTYYKKMSSEDAWMRCIHLLPIGRKVEILFDCPYRGTQCLFPAWEQLMDWPEYDPEYDYARAIWPQAEQDEAQFEGQMTTYIEEPSIFLRGVRAISHVHLRETNEVNEYEIEFETQIFGFYAPYRNQIPFSSPGAQLFTLATTQLGHSYNWVVCEVVRKEETEVMEEGGSRIIELEILKKVGVLRTDSCSELLVGSPEGGSFIKKINALFV